MTTPESIALLGGQVTFPRELLQQCSLSDTRLCTFLGGSLIEGLGNAASDLDIYAIGEALPQLEDFSRVPIHRLLTSDRRILRPGDDPKARVFVAHYALGDSRMKVDVEFQIYSNVLSLAERVRELHAYAAANLVLLTRRLTPREEDFITRLLNGRPLSGADAFEDLQNRFDRRKVQYLAYRWLASDFSIVLDIIGAWSDGDSLRAVDIARENVLRQVQAYLHLKGMLNLKRKWLLRFVDRLLADEAELADRFHRLFFFAGVEDARQFVRETLDFCDEIFVRSERLLIENASAPTGTAALELLSRDRELSDSKYADLEFEYRAKVYGCPGRATRDYLEGRL
jgi:hypothetical protein